MEAGNIFLTARNPGDETGPTFVDIRSYGDDDDFDGTINLQAPNVTIGSKGKIDVCLQQSDDEYGKIALVNRLDGTIRLMQGTTLKSPTIALASDPPSINLTVGDASLVLNSTGITLQFGDAKITLDKSGVTVSCTNDNQITVKNKSVTMQATTSNYVYLDSQQANLDGVKVAVTAASSCELKCCDLTETASGKVTRNGSLTQVD